MPLPHIRVSMLPGSMATTCMPHGRSSLRSASVSASIANFDDWYGPRKAFATRRPIPLEVPVMTSAPRDKAPRSLCLGIEGEDPADVSRPVLRQALEREPARLGDFGAVELHRLAVELAAEAPEEVALTVDALE